MMSIDKVELRRLAKLATPGPWHDHGCGSVSSSVPVKTVARFYHQGRAGTLQQGYEGSGANAAFVAAANPATIIALLDEQNQLAAELANVKRQLSDCADSLHGEMLQKYHGQDPADMHPVTRQEYQRDMDELSGYRAALAVRSQVGGTAEGE
ncbi:ead/Ea22-like family protein [Pseudomonas sp. UBA6323]|uniref:ead/Ea22-like family protein n=1 Tax=Pseudomonas sp. UBA6323 TaxID=1947329 RepID=UPI0025EF7666|nr:ead/Ea22-like family protein [Pseudomonas sp. UBA6323]